jgi:hypothetical protein
MSRRFRIPDRRSAIAVVVALLVGYYMIGTPAGVLTVLAIGLYLVVPESTGPAAAFAALALLLVAMLATIIEHSLGPQFIGLKFADNRPTASTAAASAGALAAVSVVIGAFTERRENPPDLTASGQHGNWRGRLRSVIDRYAPIATALVLAAGVRIVLAPEALSNHYATVVDNMFAGESASSGLGGTLIAPLGPVLVLAVPIGAEYLLLVAGLGTVAVAVRIGLRLGGRRASWMAGLAAAVLPSLWGQQLPAALATLGIGLGFLLLCDAPTAVTKRSAGAGLMVGLAVVAEPTAALAIPVFAAWIVATSQRPRLRELGPFLATSLVCVIVAGRWVFADAGGIPALPSPAGQAGYPLGVFGIAVDVAAYVLVLWGWWGARRREGLVLVVLPPVALAASVITAGGGGIWSWSAVLVAAAAGAGLANVGQVSAAERIESARVPQ